MPSISAAEFLRVAEGRRNDLRSAVAAHRAAQRDEMRRGEAIAGRRLTPAERIVPAPMPAARLLPAPRSQRP